LKGASTRLKKLKEVQVTRNQKNRAFRGKVAPKRQTVRSQTKRCRKMVARARLTKRGEEGVKKRFSC